MKKTTLITFLTIALSASSVSFSQTLQDREKITQGYNLLKSANMAQEISSYAEESYARAIQLAQQKGWPLKLEYDDGGFGELVGVLDDDSPLYYRTYNKGGVSTIRANAVHTGGRAGLDLNGENMIVGVWDDGTVLATHELFEGRVVKKDLTRAKTHGTHVAGTLIGSATVHNGEAIGVAPKATLHSYDWNKDYSEMISEAESGLLVSNHSYGVGTIDDSGKAIVPSSYFGQYDQGSQYIDDILYQFEYYLPVWAAGNDLSYFDKLNPDKMGYDLLTREANSKNNLVVGSIYELSTYTSPKLVTISPFSSFGPTDDGRVKPDISTKGSRVYSATSTSDSSYGTMSGTSMATPSAAGGLLLMQQHAKETYGEFLRSATLRALVAHTALKAGAEGNPNYRFGWGVMNVEGAVDVITNDKESSLVKEMQLIDGQGYLRSIEVSEMEDLIATLAWTDLPGSLSKDTDDRTPVLVNDLDMRLFEIGGDTYFPYVLDPEEPKASATTGDNFRDNIEKIEIANPVGMYNLAISHKGSLAEGKQNLSLILSGLVNQPLILETYDHNKVFCASAADEQSLSIRIISEDNVGNTVVTLEEAPQQITASLDTSNLNDGIVKLNISDFMSSDTNTYKFKLKAKNGSNETYLHPVIHVLNDTFEPVELVSPENGEDMLEDHVILTWNTMDNNDRVKSYTVEIATDEDFVNILDKREGLVGGFLIYRGVDGQGIPNNADYYWRVKAVGECGDGEYSETFVFHTYDLSVSDFNTTNFAVYPNPATNLITITSPTLIKQVEVINILGQKVITMSPNSGQVQLNINNLSTGNYLLRISDDTTTQVKRLIKK